MLSQGVVVVEVWMPGPSSSRQVDAPRAMRRVTLALADVLSTTPDTAEPVSASPRIRAQAIAGAAGTRAALVSAAMSLPPGPFGWLTILPEIIGVWRIQAQMVADIGGAYGRSAALSRSTMVQCLVRHAAAQAARDLAVRHGERLLVRRWSLRAIESIACRIGIRVGRRTAAHGIARALPVVGAVATAWHAHHDTQQVAASAIALFEDESSVRPGSGDEGPSGEGSPHAAT